MEKYKTVAGQLQVAEGMTQCSNTNNKKRCQHVFAEEFHLLHGKMQSIKRCEPCRQARNGYSKQPYAKDASKKNHARSRPRIKAAEERFRAKPGQKAKLNLKVAFSEVLSGNNGVTAGMKKAGWASVNAVLGHFESTWPKDGSMSWGNYGSGPGTWQNGHRIAQKHYGPGDNNLRRSFSKANLFAQDSVENGSEQTKLPSDAELLQVRPYWPTNWNGNLPNAEQRKHMETKSTGFVEL